MKKIVVTLGEPAGIGPDLGVLLSQKKLSKNIIFIADPLLIYQSADKLNKKIDINVMHNTSSKTYSNKNLINLLPVKLNVKNKPGMMNYKNSEYVINSIRLAANLCLEKEASAMVTGPISKSILNKAGYKISGHTEFLADICKKKSLMLLMNKKIKVALHTTHLPIQSVTKEITKIKLKKTISLLNEEMKKKFAISKPKILVTGLNPHAGEDGLLGQQDSKIIAPVIKDFQKKNVCVDGPVAADTAFLRKNIAKYDVILTMYHDQGLPVIKFDNFKTTVNVTLGLPIVRVSVDHGTALDLVGTGKIDTSSFEEAIKVAKKLCNA
ncbi:MAG: 4-hydroxythreonine-4-phosphate dehydrogenase PdxA [Pseudomonadota bacterium]|nr:4-hydroxythreonine-4-phosphate dehydrogenase PdxA [Pseudomonadota bacterium]